jgi:hypothetical protein
VKKNYDGQIVIRIVMINVIHIVNQNGTELNMIIQLEKINEIIQHLNIAKVSENDGDYQQKMN